MLELPPLDHALLPAGIRARFVPGINGLRCTCWRPASRGSPACCCCTAFPELAYSWRKVMPAAGRGRLPRRRARPARLRPHHRLGRRLRRRPRARSACSTWCATRSGWSPRSGYRTVAAVVGHDFGSPVAAWCALVRPDVFRSRGADERAVRRPARAAVRHGDSAARQRAASDIHAALAALDAAAQALPVVLLDARRRTTTCGTARRACTPSCAPTTTTRAPTGRQNKPLPLAGWTAEELAKMPTYYIMDLDKGMAETVAPDMPSRSRDRRLPVAARQRARRLQPRSTTAPASRAGCSGTAAAPRG